VRFGGWPLPTSGDAKALSATLLRSLAGHADSIGPRQGKAAFDIGGHCRPSRVNDLREAPRGRRATCLDTPAALSAVEGRACPRQCV
jgi:hypothetical protein